MATVLAELWMEVDLAVPYSAGELLARVQGAGHGGVRVSRRGRAHLGPGAAVHGGRPARQRPPSWERGAQGARRAAATSAALHARRRRPGLEVQVRRLDSRRDQRGALLQVA